MTNPTVITNPDGSTTTVTWAPPQAPPPSGTHTAIVTIVDAVKTWTVTATLGNDPTQPAVLLLPADSAGNLHPGIQCAFYADGVDIFATRFDNPYDWVNHTLSVTCDGVTVFPAQTVNFWRLARQKTIRYGVQAAWNSVDLTLFPNYPTTGPFPTPPDLSKFDFSYNGLGLATYKGMGSTGDRSDIGPIPAWDIPQVVNPSDANFAVVRAAADNSGAFACYASDPVTGMPIDISTYPFTTTLPKASGTWALNPIVPYLGTNDGQTIIPPTSNDKVSGCPYQWDEAHETGYNVVAAASTGTARDKDHLAFWANNMLICLDPVWRQNDGVFQHYQERGSAWALMRLFQAKYLSSMGSYFTARLNQQLSFATLLPQNSFGILGTYKRPGANGPNSGIAVWQENYVRVALGVMAAKDAAWQPFAQYLCNFVVSAMAQPYYPLMTLYVLTVTDASGNYLPSLADMVTQSLVSGNKWSAADAAAATASGVTLAQVYALMQKYGFTGKEGDFMQYDAAPGAYPALMRAGVASAVIVGCANAQAAWTTVSAVPTPPVFGNDWRFNLSP